MIDRMVYLFIFLAYLSPVATPATDHTKPNPPTVQELDDRVTELRDELRAAQEKADRSALDADYTQRVQKQYESYYEKAFNTQIWILTIFGLILTVLLAFTARFGLSIFDRQIDNALRETSTQLRSEFGRTLEEQIEKLRAASTTQTSALELKFAELVNQQEKDLKTRSLYQFHFSQGLTFSLADRYADAVRHFHVALELYKRGKPTNLFADTTQASLIANIFRNVWSQHEGQEERKKAMESELKSGIYKGLETELDTAAAKMPALAKLLTQQSPTADPIAD